MNESTSLRIEDLHKRYKSGWGHSQAVLAGVSLNVERGEVYGLLGRNGAGKSTAFRLIMGQARPDGGRIEILGGRPGRPQVLLRVGFCPENPQFPPNLSVLEVLRFHGALVRSRIPSPRTRIDWLIEQFELAEQKGRTVRTLSRGTTQRLALALTLLARPDLLVLDEPLTGLDPLSRHRVLEILRDQKRAGTAMILSSHILADLEDIADRLGVLARGRVQRELSLAIGPKGADKSLDIRIPAQFVKAVEADVAELESFKDGDSQCYAHIPFERAQELVKHWSAAGIPILEMLGAKPPGRSDILAKLIDSETDAPVAAERVKEPV